MANRRLFNVRPGGKPQNQQAVHNSEVRQVKMANLQNQAGSIMRSVPLSPKQQLQMDSLGKSYTTLTEIYNPKTSSWDKAGAGVKLLNSVLPPDKQINMENAIKVAVEGARVFQGVPKEKGTTVMNSSYGLSKAPNPKRISLNSGVAPNTSANDFMQAKLGLCSPMHVSGVSLLIPPSGDLFTYFSQTIAFDIQTRAQTNVSYSLDIQNRISASQLLTAFNATINALHVYFFYTSILSYESDTRNKNQGMINLRQNVLTAQIISDLAQLGRRLEDTPIPPRIVEWVRYMNGNFLSGDSQGASIIKLTFNPDALTNPNLNAVQAALTSLTTDANNSLFSLLRSAVPQWRIKKLYDVPAVPQYDKNFLTIFANLQSYSSNAGQGATYLPTVTTTADVISYNSFHNKLDGVAFAMCSININGQPAFPGLCIAKAATPVSSVTDSRYSFYTDGATASWTPATGNNFLRFSRLESYSPLATGAAVTTVHLPGAEKAQNVNCVALVQTGQNVLDFLFKIDSIPVKGTLSSFNRRGDGRI